MDSHHQPYATGQEISMLRVWQKECVNLALNNYQNGKNHFLAQATPGAGKTIMAANLAKQMLEKNLIDFVLCFSPSKIVSNSISACFSSVLGRSFDGRLGSIGCSMTYQYLQYLDEQFWQTLSRYRVLCVFDEIHHCAGDDDSNTNSWGHHILYDVQKVSTYTLALTGTPWRSNLTPIVLSSYTDPDGAIVCDYQYTLVQAVQDGVCRKPTIALIDCEESVIKANNQIKSFGSLDELISTGEINYSAILNDKSALLHIVEIAVDRLANIRTQSSSAGGLIVATSVNHAIEIASLLQDKYCQTTTIVTYKNEGSHEQIEQFKTSTTEWIVSVGMVSEGTDIPRLQVCCHLSNITTELYFRQILGRILRMTASPNQEAWLYTFAAPKLIAFAEEIEQDIPDCCTYLKLSNKTTDIKIQKTNRFSLNYHQLKGNTATLNFSQKSTHDVLPKLGGNTDKAIELSLISYKQRIIEAFQHR